MFKNAEELLELTTQRGCRVSDIVLARECALTQKKPEEVYARLRAYLGVMREAAEAAREVALPTRGGLISGDAKKLSDYAKAGRTVCGNALVTAVVIGDVAAVKAAVDAGAQAVKAIQGELVSVHVIARPHPDVDAVLPKKK